MSFYRIIKDPSRGKLEIPEKFVRLHGASLGSSVRLRTSCGSEWKINLVKRHGRVRFDEGWPEFSKRFRLEVGDLLVFRSYGSSYFIVTIFDSSEVEKSRPLKNESDEVEILECSDDSSAETDSERPSSSTRISRQSVRGTKAFEEAKLYKPQNPFFRTVIRQNRNYHANVPSEFGKKHMRSGNESVTLKTMDGKPWTVGVRVGRGRSRFFLCGGFYKFVKDNRLVPGDVCVYELEKRDIITLHVKIFRNYLM